MPWGWGDGSWPSSTTGTSGSASALATPDPGRNGGSSRRGQLDAEGSQAWAHPLGQEPEARQVVDHGRVHVPPEVFPEHAVVVTRGHVPAIGLHLADLGGGEAHVAVGVDGEDRKSVV